MTRKGRATCGLQEIKGEDTFRETKKLHSDMALVSHMIDSESIQEDQRVVVYDYKIIKSLYVFFQLTYLCGKFDYQTIGQSFTTSEEMINLLQKIIFRELLIQFTYDEDSLLPRREKVTIQSQREFFFSA